MGGGTPAEPSSTTALVASTLLDWVNRISSLAECTRAANTKRMYNNLLRRIKLLNPFFEELADCHHLELGKVEVEAFEELDVALGSAYNLLNSINRGSKIYQVWFRAFLLLFIVCCCFGLCDFDHFLILCIWTYIFINRIFEI